MDVDEWVAAKLLRSLDNDPMRHVAMAFAHREQAERVRYRIFVLITQHARVVDGHVDSAALAGYHCFIVPRAEWWELHLTRQNDNSAPEL